MRLFGLLPVLVALPFLEVRGTPLARASLGAGIFALAAGAAKSRRRRRHPDPDPAPDASVPAAPVERP